MISRKCCRASLTINLFFLGELGTLKVNRDGLLNFSQFSLMDVDNPLAFIGLTVC